MKADRCGTVTEQIRYRQGWYNSNERPRCDNCRHGHVTETPTGVKVRCLLGDFATSPAAGCEKHEKQEKKP